MDGKTAATPRTKSTPAVATAATPSVRKPDGSASRGSSKSPAECKTPDPAASLSARMGSMVLMDKEVEGLVFEASEQVLPRTARWSVVGKSCSSRPLNKTVLERTMQRAWGLHKEARFRDLGNNVFVVHFGCEGDWKHALNNGPWQYDFSVLILKDYEGGTRPSEMVFDKIDVWFQVHDLPPDKRMVELGKALGNWMGKVIRVDVDKEGFARGDQLRVRATISVYEPLVRGFYLKSLPDDKKGTWYDFSYEKVPHFCFECGRLVHVEGVCVPPVDSSQQWGGWLRTSSGKTGLSREGSQGATVKQLQQFWE